MADGPPDLTAVAARTTVPLARSALAVHWQPCTASWATLACALPTGHRSTEHYDRARRELWLHPDDVASYLSSAGG